MLGGDETHYGRPAVALAMEATEDMAAHAILRTLIREQSIQRNRNGNAGEGAVGSTPVMDSFDEKASSCTTRRKHPHKIFGVKTSNGLIQMC